MTNQNEMQVRSLAPRATKRARTDGQRWAAVVKRDATADGTFVTCVKTTGIYCRPSCPARRPLRKNVVFHDTNAAAQSAGFRACKRCRPDTASMPETQALHATKVEQACRLIEAGDETLSLASLARAVGLSTHYFHRVFRDVTGLTPKAYALARREDRMRDELTSSASVTDAIYAAGYSSTSRFYDTASRALGMKPTAYRAGGVGSEICMASSDCSLGVVLVAATEKGICAVLLGDDAEALGRDVRLRFRKAHITDGDAALHNLLAEVVQLIENPRAGIALPLDIRGTAFQHRVWQALSEIRLGETATYSAIAERIGAPAAMRAVAGACAANPVAVVIPCHRVIGRSGKLTGYRWGLSRKRALLDREQSTRPASQQAERLDQAGQGGGASPVQPTSSCAAGDCGANSRTPDPRETDG